MSVTAATPLSINVTIVTTNFTTQSYGIEDTVSYSTLDMIQIIILSLTFALCLFGNILLMSAIIWFPRLRTVSNYLILNLAICDIITAVFSIPFSLVSINESYLFGLYGCKLIYPIATYGGNASAFTLISIAIERFVNISSLGFTITKNMVLLFILLIHTSSIASVVPYSYHLTYQLYDEKYYCYESWYGTSPQKIYTISLFLLQYGLPLPIMTVLYSLAWRKIHQQNKKMIKMSEDYAKKVTWEDGKNKSEVKEKTKVTFDYDSNKSTTSVAIETKEQPQSSTIDTTDPVLPESEENSTGIRKDDNNLPIRKKGKLNRASIKATFRRSETLRSMRLKIKELRKPNFVSRAAYLRYKQTVRILTMFTIVVIVFLIFALPNQVIWLLRDFNENPPAEALGVVFNCLVYVNSVVNCWIYAGFQKGFRKAYKKILTCGYYQEKKVYTDFPTTFSILSTSEDNRYEARNNAFGNMFQQHLTNFEKFQHLYNSAEDKENEEEEEESTLLQPQYKSKRRLTFSNILGALTPGHRRTSSISLSSGGRMLRKPSLILPFTRWGADASNTMSTSTECINSKDKSLSFKRSFSLEASLTSSTVTTPEVLVARGKRRASTPGRWHVAEQQTDHNIPIKQKRVRKNSLMKIFTSNFASKKVDKQFVEPENEISCIRMLSDDKLVEPLEIHQVNAVSVQKQTVLKVKKREQIYQRNNCTQLKQQFIGKPLKLMWMNNSKSREINNILPTVNIQTDISTLEKKENNPSIIPKTSFAPNTIFSVEPIMKFQKAPTETENVYTPQVSMVSEETDSAFSQIDNTIKQTSDQIDEIVNGTVTGDALVDFQYTEPTSCTQSEKKNTISSSHSLTAPNYPINKNGIIVKQPFECNTKFQESHKGNPILIRSSPITERKAKLLQTSEIDKITKNRRSSIKSLNRSQLVNNRAAFFKKTHSFDSTQENPSTLSNIKSRINSKSIDQFTIEESRKGSEKFTFDKNQLHKNSPSIVKPDNLFNTTVSSVKISTKAPPVGRLITPPIYNRKTNLSTHVLGRNLSQ